MAKGGFLLFAIITLASWALVPSERLYESGQLLDIANRLQAIALGILIASLAASALVSLSMVRKVVGRRLMLMWAGVAILVFVSIAVGFLIANATMRDPIVLQQAGQDRWSTP